MYKNTRRNILYPMLLAIAMVAGVYIGLVASRKAQPAGSHIQHMATNYKDNKLVYILSLIDKLYVDSVNVDSMTEKVIPELIGQLDPHSAYIPADNYAAYNETLDGEFDGVGIVFNMMTDTIVVLSVVPGGPSEKAGMQNGDRVIMIDDSLVAGQKISTPDIMKMLRGKRGSDVKLSVKRSGIESLQTVNVVRGVIPIKSLDAVVMLQHGIGCIKLTSFSKNSYNELNTALNTLSDRGMTDLVLDLRGNTGGFLDQAIMITNEFLAPEKLIVYTENKFKSRIEEYSDGRGRYSGLGLVVLIDEQSASSSEILAGAIQDNDRGLIIGRRSFGKGLVQQQIPFSDGSAVRLTIARYYTPTGRSIQKPYDMGSDEYYEDFAHRVDHNELFSADSISFADSLERTTPGGRVVYGGGGIMPDIFVPLDTTGVSAYYTLIYGRNILYRYTLNYVDNHRAELNAIKSTAQMDAFFDADPTLLEKFVAYAQKQGLQSDRKGIARSKDLIVAQLKANIARNTPLDDSGFYYYIYNIDNVMQKAIEEIRDGNVMKNQQGQEV